MGILLFFITPGGEGLKAVAVANPDYNLVDNQTMLARTLGLTAKIDKGTKDSSRLSYIPKWDDILYMDEEKLFNYDNPLYDEKYGKQYRQGNSQGRLYFLTSGMRHPKYLVRSKRGLMACCSSVRNRVFVSFC